MAGRTTPTTQTTANPQTTMSTNAQQQTQTVALGPDEEELELPSVVVYLVEPFSLGGANCPDRRRLAILALLRAFSAAVNGMPEAIRANVNVQVGLFWVSLMPRKTWILISPINKNQILSKRYFSIVVTAFM
jgi:mediator of RNA polymerase II transcription subunit 13